MEKYIVKIMWDEEAKGWVAICDEIPLTLYADTIELLIKDVVETAPEILELNGIKDIDPTLSFQIEERLRIAI
jgi:hypothetical protein